MFRNDVIHGRWKFHSDKKKWISNNKGLLGGTPVTFEQMRGKLMEVVKLSNRMQEVWLRVGRVIGPVRKKA